MNEKKIFQKIQSDVSRLRTSRETGGWIDIFTEKNIKRHDKLIDKISKNIKLTETTDYNYDRARFFYLENDIKRSGFALSLIDKYFIAFISCDKKYFIFDINHNNKDFSIFFVIEIAIRFGYIYVPPKILFLNLENKLSSEKVYNVLFYDGCWNIE